MDNMDLESLISRYSFVSEQIRKIRDIEKISGRNSESLKKLLKEHKLVKAYLKNIYKDLDDADKQTVTSGTDILIRREIERNAVDDNGDPIEVPMVHIGLDFVHEQFNDGKLFPLSTFLSLTAAQGVGKSDYLYRMANRMLLDGHNVLLLSFEFGEERLGNYIAPVESGGKDRLRDARLAGKLDNLFVNYYSKDTDSLSLMIDMAHTNDIDVVLIDSFGEIERGDGGEYMLQQEIAIMLNSKVNSKRMFIAIIAQTNNTQIEGEYKIKGGNDLAYKPDVSLFIRKLYEEDTSGERIVHLIKNRDSDNNGKTIITTYDFEKREPTFKEVFDASKHSKEPTRYRGSRRSAKSNDDIEAMNEKKNTWMRRGG